MRKKWGKEAKKRGPAPRPVAGVGRHWLRGGQRPKVTRWPSSVPLISCSQPIFKNNFVLF
jgi:hypothetical protein